MSSASATPAAKAFVQTTIAQNKVVVFSKTYCPYASKAKSTMKSLLPSSNYVVIELDQRPDGDEIQDALAEATGGRTVPRVFVGGVFIGGGDDTVRKASTGELQTLLAQVGALP
ncbi:hypothetical protein FOA52_007685 [Chlamydomonas sp. UWO 241]|nr:hypothetical protein FOA52_007685 [Chlamydomonas sp. UWO 241]